MDNAIKKCCTCLVEKPLSDFNKYKASRDGRQPRCRECQRIRRVEWYAANREREIARARAWNLANPERVRANDRARDPEKRALSQRKSYLRHREIRQAAIKARRDADIEASRERERQWRAANAESVAARRRKYRETNPNVRLIEQAKNARRRRSFSYGNVSLGQLQARLDYFGNLCWICSETATTVDHVKPLSKGGAHLPSNLRPACAPCNFRKHNKWYGVGRIEDLREWVLQRNR